MLMNLSLTALAHTTHNGTVKALVHVMRRVSLYAGGLVLTLVFTKYGFGALNFCYGLLAVYGLVGAIIVMVLSNDTLSRFNSVRWIATLNLMVVLNLMVIKAKSIATGRPWAPEDINTAWLWYSVFYLISTWTTRMVNMPPYTMSCLSWCDRYIAHIEPKDGAIRSTCGLCLSMVNFTGLMMTNESVSVFVMLIIILQLCINFILAFRFSAKCPDAKLTEPFVFQTYINLGESLVVARKQASQGVLPRFSPMLFCIALFSSFNTLSPAYCSGPLDDEAVASPEKKN